MRTITCDGLDRNWSVITFGCWQIAPSEGWGDVCSKKDADRAVKAALEQGITAFDTAEGYGDGESERRLGQALGQKKNDVIIISKIWPDAELTLTSYRKHLEDSLTALGREYLDVYLIHWPGSYFNTPEKSARLCDIMNALKESGKTRSVGLSNFHESLIPSPPHPPPLTLTFVSSVNVSSPRTTIRSPGSTPWRISTMSSSPRPRSTVCCFTF